MKYAVFFLLLPLMGWSVPTEIIGSYTGVSRNGNSYQVQIAAMPSMLMIVGPQGKTSTFYYKDIPGGKISFYNQENQLGQGFCGNIKCKIDLTQSEIGLTFDKRGPVSNGSIQIKNQPPIRLIRTSAQRARRNTANHIR